VPLPTALDHLVYAVPDLNDALDNLARQLGVVLLPGGSHPAWGTRNAILPLSASTYLEVIGPDPDGSFAGPPAVFGINQLTQPRLATWAAKGADLPGIILRGHQANIRLGQPMAGGRIRADG